MPILEFSRLLQVIQYRKGATSFPQFLMIWQETGHIYSSKMLKIINWDAQLLINFKKTGLRIYLFPGNVHEVMVDLEGMGGGGKVQLEVGFKDYTFVKKYF